MPHKHRPSILINCSNLHVGGGVAVAASFIDSLSRLRDYEIDISLLISSAVHSNILALRTDTSIFKSCTVCDYFGIQSIWKGLHKHFKDQDLVFTVFGPAYFLFKETRHIFGFAQPFIIYPSITALLQMSLMDRLKQRLIGMFQERFFRRADELIVELEHVKIELCKRSLFSKKPVHIVYSSVDSLYTEPERWSPVVIPETKQAIKLGIISRNYPHKNLGCLPSLKECLSRKYQLDVEIFVTFQKQEWDDCSDHFKSSINNVGSLTLAQCPSFYSQMDGVIFPSLLECFSAVPIETMMMMKPLFASDLPFIKDCCHEFANYFDPLSIDSMAEVIAIYFLHKTQSHDESLQRAHEFVQRYSDLQGERAQAYLRIALNALERRQ